MNTTSNFHNRRSIRLPGYDYTRPGAYFITIVTYARKHVLGKIVDRQMVMTDVGKIVISEWQRLPIRFPSIELDSYIVMPNHLHGILVIRDIEDWWETSDVTVGARGESSKPDPSTHPRAPTKQSSAQNPLTPSIERFGAPVAGSIPTIIRSYKSSVTQRYQRLTGFHSGKYWQRNYHEQVIRDNQSWEQIRGYIQNNLINWETDPENR